MDAPERDSSVSANGPGGSSTEKVSSTRAESDAAETAKQTAKSTFGDAKRMTADAAKDTSSALGDAAASLENSGQTNLSQATAALAEKLHGFSGYLENRSIDDLFDDARRLAARNPGLFMAGGVVIGIALTRFFKASIASAGRSQASLRSRDDDAAEDMSQTGRSDGESRATH